jgi:hypothetical protein
MPFGVSILLLACMRKETNSTNKREVNTDRNVLINTLFPELKAQTLSSQDRFFPKDMAGKPTIICIAFAQVLIENK